MKTFLDIFLLTGYYIDNLYIDYLYNKEDDSMPVDKSLISGSTTMLLLKLLSEKDRYGYEMIETLQSRSNNVFELKAGTLYPLLHALESKGFLTAYEKNAGGKTRKYYSITKSGLSHLKKRESEWKEYSNAVSQVLGGVVCGTA